MNYASPLHSSRWRHALGAAALVLTCATTQAAPGAHGPGGEHLDAPTGSVTAAAFPRLQAQSEAFELVAELKGGELAILVDRYETNAPVLGARLEVESGALKAVAAFRPEQGDYVVTDDGLLKVLASPGQHPLVFTLAAGDEADLLDGTLVIVEAGHSHDHGHSHAFEYAAIGGGVLLALAAGAVVVLRWRRRAQAGDLAAGGAR